MKNPRDVGQTHIAVNQENLFTCFGNRIRKVNGCRGLCFASGGASNTDNGCFVFVRESKGEIGTKKLVGFGRRKAQILADKLALFDAVVKTFINSGHDFAPPLFLENLSSATALRYASS